MASRKRKLSDSCDESASLECGVSLLSERIEKAVGSCRSRPDVKQLCPHCNALLSVKTYRKHKRLYYNSADDTWYTDLDSQETTDLELTQPDVVPPPELPHELHQSDCDSDHEYLSILPECQTSYTDDDADTSDHESFGSESGPLDYEKSEESASSLSGESDGEEVWEDCDEGQDYNEEGVDFDNESTSNPLLLPQATSAESHSQRALVMWLVGFLIQLQAKHYIPDSALNLLLKFFYTFFCVLGRYSGFVASMATQFPSTLYRLKRMLPYTHQFTRFVVCSKCWKLYKFGQCIIERGSHRLSKVCNHVKYPKHPYHSCRRECGNTLLKSVKFLSGRNLLYPYKVYCYKSLQSSLQELLLRPGFHENCQHWKSRKVSDNFSSVYDGRVWKDFLNVSEQPFLAADCNLALMLNIDWFQPYKHTVSSVGAIYLTVMNLPRHMRFKRKNILLIGIIPGPSEPKHDINTLLDPLVNELSSFWTGITLEVNRGSRVSKEVIRCAILCCACDLPAGRKVCGFLGHSASLGCSKCLKSFSGTVGNMDYSGFDRSTWPGPRTNALHRQNVQLVQQAQTKTEQVKRESELGCRYSVLLKLPYFDPPRMLIIDPMHNLFLGSGKHMLRLWLEHGLVSSSQFEQIQECVDSFVTPSDLGRLPRKIEVGFSGFTADQFKNWITIFSIPALFGILTGEHLECWRHFVLACRIVCKHSLSMSDISLADALLMHFCKRVQHLYGQSAVTPNMHMHAHLKEDLLNYGPVYEFWLFSFERYNGILGNQPTNNRLPEPQLMQRFINDNSTYSFQFPEEFQDDLNPLCMTETRLVGSVSDTVADFSVCTAFTLPTRCKYSTLDEQDRDYLKILFSKINPQGTPEVILNSVFRKYSCISMNGKNIGHSNSQLKASAQTVVMADWDVDLFGPPPTTLTDPSHPRAALRPVQIHHFAKVSVCIEEQIQYIVIARVSWYYPHPNQYLIGKPAQIWCSNLFEHYGLHSFLPVEKIVSRCVYSKRNIQDESVLIVIPLVDS